MKYVQLIIKLCFYGTLELLNYTEMSVVRKILAAFEQNDENSLTFSVKKVNNPHKPDANTVLFCK